MTTKRKAPKTGQNDQAEVTAGATKPEQVMNTCTGFDGQPCGLPTENPRHKRCKSCNEKWLASPESFGYRQQAVKREDGITRSVRNKADELYGEGLRLFTGIYKGEDRSQWPAEIAGLVSEAGDAFDEGDKSANAGIAEVKPNLLGNAQRLFYQVQNAMCRALIIANRRRIVGRDGNGGYLSNEGLTDEKRETIRTKLAEADQVFAAAEGLSAEALSDKLAEANEKMSKLVDEAKELTTPAAQDFYSVGNRARITSFGPQRVRRT